jgi:hypothetical protein
MISTDLTRSIGVVDARSGGNSDSGGGKNGRLGDSRSGNGGGRGSLAVNNECPMVDMKANRLPDPIL